MKTFEQNKRLISKDCFPASEKSLIITYILKNNSELFKKSGLTLSVSVDNDDNDNVTLRAYNIKDGKTDCKKVLLEKHYQKYDTSLIKQFLNETKQAREPKQARELRSEFKRRISSAISKPKLNDSFKQPRSKCKYFFKVKHNSQIMLSKIDDKHKLNNQFVPSQKILPNMVGSLSTCYDNHKQLPVKYQESMFSKVDKINDRQLKLEKLEFKKQELRPIPRTSHQINNTNNIHK